MNDHKVRIPSFSQLVYVPEMGSLGSTCSCSANIHCAVSWQANPSSNQTALDGDGVDIICA